MKALHSKYYRATQHYTKTMKIIMACLPATAIPSFTSPKDWGNRSSGQANHNDFENTLHQTTTKEELSTDIPGCFLRGFYIKPQQIAFIYLVTNKLKGKLATRSG